MLKYNMSYMPHGLDANILYRRSQRVEYDFKTFFRQTGGVTPTKTVLAGGGIPYDGGYKVIELFVFLYTPESVQTKGGVEPVRHYVQREDKNETGLLFAKINMKKSKPQGEFTFETKDIEKVAKSFDEDTFIFFPALIVAQTNTVFEVNYGTLTSRYHDIISIANLINNHICLYEGINGGILALPRN